MEKYYKKPVSLFKFRDVRTMLKLQTVPTLNLPIKSHRQNEEKRLFLQHYHLKNQSVKILGN